MYTLRLVYIDIHIYMCVCVYISLHVYIYICMYVCMYMYIYIYRYICVYMYALYFLLVPHGRHHFVQSQGPKSLQICSNLQMILDWLNPSALPLFNLNPIFHCR